MANVPANVIAIWTGANGSIPTGWERVTALDGYFPKSQGAEAPGITGGSNSHTHTSVAHGHTLNGHTHNVKTATYSGPAQADTPTDVVCDNHYHDTKATSTTSGGSLQDATVTWASPSGDESMPPFMNVIFVKPSGSSAPLANGLIVLWNVADAPTGFEHVATLANKYLKGAAAAANGGTTGGSLTHAHTITHGHTANAHSHTGTTNTWSGGYRDGGAPNNGAKTDHTHTVYLNNTTDTVSNYTNTTAGNGDSIEPAYHKLAAVQNTSGVSKNLTPGMICLWLGSLASIPTGWFLCNGNNGTPNLTDKFIKIINATTEIGNEGGSNTHTHTAVSHTHTTTGTHTHTGSTSGPSTTWGCQSGSQGYATSDHTHNLESVSSTSAEYANSDLTSGSAVDNQPSYKTAAYIQFQVEVGGGALFNAM